MSVVVLQEDGLIPTKWHLAKITQVRFGLWLSRPRPVTKVALLLPSGVNFRTKFVVVWFWFTYMSCSRTIRSWPWYVWITLVVTHTCSFIVRIMIKFNMCALELGRVDSYLVSSCIREWAQTMTFTLTECELYVAAEPSSLCRALHWSGNSSFNAQQKIKRV